MRHTRGHCVEDGVITSGFRGFKNRDTLFKFQSGRIYQQAEYRYCYRYAYRPRAVVVDGPDGLQLHVEGMSQPVRVRRIR